MKSFHHLAMVAIMLVIAVAREQAHAQPQSPIDFPNNVALDPKFGPPVLDYKVMPVGQVVLNEGSPNREKSIKIKFTDNALKLTDTYIKPDTTVQIDQYVLKNIHFHKRSEHTKNNGETFAMELHMVHEGPAGNLAVGRWIVVGDENVALKEVFDNLPAAPVLPATETTFPLTKVLDLNALKPPSNKQEHYRYEGSLTHPHAGSTTAVRWIFYHEPLTMSLPQMNAFGALWPGPNPAEGNFRTVVAYNDNADTGHRLRNVVPEPASALIPLAITALAVARRSTRRRQERHRLTSD